MHLLKVMGKSSIKKTRAGAGAERGPQLRFSRRTCTRRELAWQEQEEEYSEKQKEKTRKRCLCLEAVG